MRALAPLILALALSAGELRGADPKPALPSAGASRDRESNPANTAGHRPWVWEVRTKSGLLWIAGCLHLGTRRDAAAFPAYLPFYRQASTIYFETKPGAADAFEVRQLIDRRGFVRDRQTLANRLSRDAWSDVQARLGARPEKLTTITAMEPWMAAFFLAQEGYARAGLSGDHSLQSYVESKASHDRKPIGALETPKDQILAMADASPGDQEQFLRETIHGLDGLEASLRTLREAWASGDVGPLVSALGLAPGTARSGMHRSLIGDRNRRWVERIRTISERRANSLIVVGVEHLVAKPYALPDLLRQAGFSVQRVDLPSR